jgi:hypothetical protein
MQALGKSAKNNVKGMTDRIASAAKITSHRENASIKVIARVH